MKSGADGPSNAVISWRPMAVFAAAIVFVIAFAMRLPPDRTIIASSIAALMVFGGFFFASRSNEKDKNRRFDSV
jgi:hypothetical protein